MSRRGVYRGVYSALFDDPDYHALEPESRLLLLTLRQCSDAGPAAIFRYYPEKLSVQTGLSVKVITRELERLASLGWIVYDFPVVWVRNGLRYDPMMTLANPKHKIYILNTLLALPKLEIVLIFCDYYQIRYPFDRVSDTNHDQSITKTKTSTKTKTETTTVTRRQPVVLTDEQFVDSLRSNPAYQGIGIDQELGKMQAWCDANRRQRTRRFIVTWLNRQQAVHVNGGPPPRARLNDVWAGKPSGEVQI